VGGGEILRNLRCSAPSHAFHYAPTHLDYYGTVDENTLESRRVRVLLKIQSYYFRVKSPGALRTPSIKAPP
jgi:hypothetical protein